MLEPGGQGPPGKPLPASQGGSRQRSHHPSPDFLYPGPQVTPLSPVTQEWGPGEGVDERVTLTSRT